MNTNPRYTSRRVLGDPTLGRPSFRRFASFAVTAGLIWSVSAPAAAQSEDEPDEDPPEEAEADGESEGSSDSKSEEADADNSVGDGAAGSGNRRPTGSLVKLGHSRSMVPLTVLSGDDFASLQGTDLVAAAALRGLGPDRVVVLINGKRRHQMARVVVDEAIGKGTSGYDLNSIPAAAVERVEILRDSAAAEYGPNAIAGVINIVLKQGSGLQVDVSAGNYFENDGNALGGLDVVSASVHGGFEFGDSGYLNLTLDVRDRGETNRAGIATVESREDGRAFGGQWLTDDGTCPLDEFTGEVIACVPTRRLRLGDSDGQDIRFFFNAGYDLTKAVSLYAFGGISRRSGATGAGLFLGNGNGRTPAQLYPDGYLPELTQTVDDMSITVGAQTELSPDWSLDVSAGWGRNRFDYFVSNSANVSFFYEIDEATGEIFGETPTEAEAGQLINTELTLRAELTGELDVLKGLDVSGGAELRVDNYEIAEGEFASYAYGRANNFDPDDPIFNQTALPIPEQVLGGIQGFPGFRPDQAVNGSRGAWAAFVRAEQLVTDDWQVGASARFESVEFTGEAVVGKLATRYDLTDFLAIRGSASNGSRSPGVQKVYYSQRISALFPIGLVETATAGDADTLRGDFGIGQLKPETSLSASGGVVFAPDIGGPSRNLSLSVDAYQIQIKDRIELSESVTGEVPTVPPGLTDTPGRQLFRDLLEENQLGAAQFWINAVDTTTRGVDVAASWGLNLGPVGLDLAGVFNYAETRIDDSDPDSQLVTSADLFGPVQQNRMEKGEPRFTATLAQLTTFEPLAFHLAFNYYGSVTGKAFAALEDEREWSGKWLTDASVSYMFLPGFRLTVGGNNIFDVFPDEWGEVGREYPEVGYTYGLETLPFGINGGFYYAKLRYTL